MLRICNRSRVLILVLGVIACATAYALAADEAKWLGTYEQQNADKMALMIQADHKASMSSDGKPGDATWEIAGDDKIIVHMGADFTLFMTKDGNLRDDEGTVWKKTK